MCEYLKSGLGMFCATGGSTILLVDWNEVRLPGAHAHLFWIYSQGCWTLGASSTHLSKQSLSISWHQGGSSAPMTKIDERIPMSS